jgi:adenylate cyclase
MNDPGLRSYAFGRFHFDPLHGRLTNGGTVIDLRPKSLAVLHYLVKHPQRLITKEELLAAVWGRVVVTDDSLVQCVREIRHALGDTDQRYVRTLPRDGYMFVADVAMEIPQPFGNPEPTPTHRAQRTERIDRTVASFGRRWTAGALIVLAIGVVALAVVLGVRNDHSQQANSAAGSVRSSPPLSVVVLPLVNIDGDPEHDYFADGLTNDLTTDLGRVPTALVISQNTARAYRGKEDDASKVARDLGARYVLEGSVQRMRDDVRVNLRLVETESGAQHWAERFEGPRSDLARIQVDIVRRVARTLQVQLLEAAAERSARERTRNPDAQDLLMRGWALWERRQPADNAKAREHFVQATTIDSKSSLAWIGIANTHLSDLHAGWSEDRQQSLHHAEVAMSRAHQIGPRHRDVNAGRGYVMFFQGNVESALAAFDAEIEANAGNALAHVWRGLMLISLGRPAEALPSIERGIVLSPRDVDLNVFYRSMAHAHFNLARFDDALAWSRKAVGYAPKYAKGHAFLAAAAALSGDDIAATNAVDTFRRLQPKYGSVAAFRQSMMPGEMRMFDATPRFWEALQKAGLPAA